ncbi:hypothetical protein QO002_006124 [Pararhizobium capsulatum DSM 1112]|uniref:Uncharacterized protein n=1 Tax=Pararhizobium capsulatum DSM 1112 TaxID=1121113 RepID=A0ABU0C4A6_9HYPH|nr:hypothetical protein [Pararhizobium capsulatum]MDQ0323917.1 hypothetical protein [Pararhizobium capsulatum DSM 1112]
MAEEKQKPADARDPAKEQDDYLQEALEETFPASDPISPGHAEKQHPNTTSSETVS